jgi:hypothetical protein
MDSIVKLNQPTADGGEIVVAVDFTQQKVSVIIVDKKGKMSISDVQALHVKGS